jgi:regulator of sigma E protease
MNYFFIIVIIGFLIFIHELGHFVFAKASGIAIETFSVGFGPKIFKRNIKGTEYCISAVPLGGYILPAIKDESEFYKIPVLKRIIFCIGGPLANVILPVIILIVAGIFNSSTSIAGIFINPFIQIFNNLFNIIKAIPSMFSSPEHLSGIVGIISIGSKIIASNTYMAINLLISLSLSLAVFNMLPIPALDGGKIILYLLEKIHPKLLKIQLPATIAGWVLIAGLTVYVTIKDVVKIFA